MPTTSSATGLIACCLLTGLGCSSGPSAGDARDRAAERGAELGPDGIRKNPCPYPSGASLCPAGQYCLDYKRCATLGASQVADCTGAPETERSIGASTEQVGFLPATLKGQVANKTSTSFSVSSGDKTVDVRYSLPPEMTIDVADGDPLTLELCPVILGPGYVYAVRAFDPAGQLVFAGADGTEVTPTACFSKGPLQVTREELSCGVHAPTPPYAEWPYVPFALKFSGDTSVTLGQRGRGEVTIGGRSYQVASFVSFHTLEWTATDVGGAYEVFAVVRK